MERTETIQVESGKILKLMFTYFSVVWESTCSDDYVKITDGDGTTLMDKSCGYSSDDPSDSLYILLGNITSRSNTVEILFHTDDIGAWRGWSLNWVAVTPGIEADH